MSKKILSAVEVDGEEDIDLETRIRVRTSENEGTVVVALSSVLRRAL
jgi:hypothetical protein